MVDVIRGRGEGKGVTDFTGVKKIASRTGVCVSVCCGCEESIGFV